MFDTERAPSSRPAPFARFGSGRVAELFARPASIDLSRAHPIAALLSRQPHDPLGKHSEGRRLTTPPVTDRPRLIGWSSLDLAHRQISDVLRRRVGTSCRFQYRPEARETRVLRRTARSHPRDLDPRPEAPRGAPEHGSGRLPSCPIDRVAPVSNRDVPLEGNVAPRAPFSPRSPRCARQRALRNTPWPASRRRLALRLTGRRDARCVGPTSAISLPRTSTRASWAPHASGACTRAQWRNRLFHDSANRFGGDTQFLMGTAHFGGHLRPVAMRAACL